MHDKLHILYVEDEADIRDIAAFALEDEDFEMLFCASGEEALEKISDFSPGLILLDVMMPGMDGPTTLKQLREIPEFKNTPVAFLTAKVQPKEIDQFIALGAIDVIPKPFDPMTLADRIREIMDRS